MKRVFRIQGHGKVNDVGLRGLTTEAAADEDGAMTGNGQQRRCTGTGVIKANLAVEPLSRAEVRADRGDAETQRAGGFSIASRQSGDGQEFRAWLKQAEVHVNMHSKGWVYDNIFCECLGLTRREGEVLTRVTDGKTNAEIGTILGTSPRTVQKHLQHIFEKLGVETRTAAAVRALNLTSLPTRQ